jgi:hypothetical protein
MKRDGTRMEKDQRILSIIRLILSILPIAEILDVDDLLLQKVKMQKT